MAIVNTDSLWCKEARKKMIDLDMTQVDLAKRSGYTRVYISMLLSGRVYSADAVNRVSDVLGIKSY